MLLQQIFKIFSKPFGILLPSLGCLVSFGGAIEFENNRFQLECAHSVAGAPLPDSADFRKYAPDRKVDILHLLIDVTPDFKKRTVKGETTLTFRPIAKTLDVLRLDGVDLEVQRVTSTRKIGAYQVTDTEVIITFDPAIAPGEETKVTISYSAQPQKGLYFRTPEMGYKTSDTHLFTQGEATEARHWYPCYDFPNEKFTSEVICRVPADMTVLSNGRLVDSKTDPTSGLKVVRWHQEKPHVNYLISLLAGYFTRLEGRHRDIPMSFYTAPSESAVATNSFKDTADMMAFFEKEIGVPYPWAKYDQVTVQDFGWGGMENTSITTLNERTLFPVETENVRSSQGLVAHELAHQWFGDLVTCKDWSHIWLNEGFATYYAHLYDGHKNGRDSMLYELYSDARGFLNLTNDTRAIVFRKYGSPDEMFNYLAYPKGSWVLHMLRSELGDELYRSCIQTYLERHQYDTVVTEDLNAVVEELSGRSFDSFFDQWVYHAHHPELEIQYSWDEKTKFAKFSIRQVQKINEEVVLFQFPLTLRAKTSSGTFEQKVRIREKVEDFFLSLPQAPTQVRVDPEFSLLAKINFKLPNAMLFAQLADPGDMIGRLRALEQLVEKKDAESVAKIKAVLNQDSFYGVRLEAARALRTIHTEEALEALLSSTDQPDARVRLQVLSSLGGFYDQRVAQVVRDFLNKEKNPDLLAQAIRNLGVFPQPWAAEIIRENFNRPSFRSMLADGAMAAARTQDNPELIPSLLQTLKGSETNFPSSVFGRGLEALSYLARNEKDKGEVREFLFRFATHPRKSLQLSALGALGTLGDSQGVPLLRTFADGRLNSPERPVAERALISIAAHRRPFDELRDLRTELLDLKKDNLELKKQLRELERKFQVQAIITSPTTEKKGAQRSGDGKGQKVKTEGRSVSGSNRTRK